MTDTLRLLISQEVRGAFRARWFGAYAGLFLAGGLLLTTVGLADPVVFGYRGFAKAFAGMIHLALLFVPLLALLPASATIADGRENGVLEYLLAQPVSSDSVFGGKLIGVSFALVVTVAVGFGAAAGVAALRGVPLTLVAVLFGFVLLLALCFASVGTALSGIVKTRARAVTAAMVCWLLFTSLGTLGIVYVAVKWGVPAPLLVVWSFVNPVEAFRVGVLSVLDPDLGLLGPLGALILEQLGPTGTGLLGAFSLVAWIVGAGLAGRWWFSARGYAAE